MLPTSLKSATITPVLKKANLDPENMKNYRPVSNLPFLTKLIEKEAVRQMNHHMTAYNLHEEHQSAYRQHHSTETVLVKIFNDLLCSLDKKKGVILVLLDLSAAFDTVEHDILLKRMKNLFGISGNVLVWLNSYFTDRYQSVQINGKSSSQRPLPYGVPQGSMVGPFCFPKYSSPLTKIAAKYGLTVHLYADDTQLYISFDSDDAFVSREKMEACLEEIRTWMSDNLLKLNESKTEYILITPKYVSPKLSDIDTISIGDDIISATQTVKNIGAVIDDKLCMSPQISSILKSCYCHLRYLSQIRKYLSIEAATTLVHAFITSKLDNLNALLFGLPDYQIDKLQLVQNHAAKLILKKGKYDSVTPLLKMLHWLPVSARIEYKLLLLTYKCLHGLAPSYLSSLLKPYKPTRLLRSSDQDLLEEPHFRTETYGKRSFSASAPRLWNKLPKEVKSAKSLDVFKSKLKTHLFKKAYQV